MPKTILLIDDDPQQAETFQAELRAHYGEASIKHLEAEWELYEFVETVAAGISAAPDLVIADIMLPWAVPSPSAPPRPDAVKEGGYSRAGVRCLRKFRELIDHPVPWILFSILEPATVAQEISDLKHPEKIAIVNKVQPLAELFREIDRLTCSTQSTDGVIH